MRVEQSTEHELVESVFKVGVPDGRLVLVLEFVGPAGVVREVLENRQRNREVVAADMLMVVLLDSFEVVVVIAENPNLRQVELPVAEDFNNLFKEVFVSQHPEDS